MSTTLIKTVNGETIMIQQDVTNLRPYSRSILVSGTKGIAQEYPEEHSAFDPEAHEFLNSNKMDSNMKLYEHLITKEVGKQAKNVDGHGGKVFIMDYCLIYCLNFFVLIYLQYVIKTHPLPLQFNILPILLKANPPNSQCQRIHLQIYVRSD